MTSAGWPITGATPHTYAQEHFGRRVTHWRAAELKATNLSNVGTRD